MLEPKKTKRRIYDASVRLRAIREELKETQAQAAREFGLSRVQYARWEKEGIPDHKAGYALEGIRLILYRRHERARQKRHYDRRGRAGQK